MDSNSAAIENDLAFGFDEAAEIPFIQAPTTQVLPAPETVSVDAGATDLELCQLAAAGNIAAFEVMVATPR